MNTQNLTQLVPGVKVPVGLGVTHLMNIERKALTVMERYIIGTFRNDAGELTGLFSLTPISGTGFGYEVDTMRQICSCPGFKACGLCAHLIAVIDHVSTSLWVDEMDQVIKNHIDSRAGTEADAAAREAWRLATLREYDHLREADDIRTTMLEMHEA